MDPLLYILHDNFRARAFDNDDAIGAIILTGKTLLHTAVTSRLQLDLNNILLSIALVWYRVINADLYDTFKYFESLKFIMNSSDFLLVTCLGSDKSFAAGADIKEMASRTYVESYMSNMFRDFIDVAKIRKPTIAAVSGFALGGGCELAMMCDIIIASETAKFGQPEIALGVIPGTLRHQASSIYSLIVNCQPLRFFLRSQ